MLVEIVLKMIQHKNKKKKNKSDFFVLFITLSYNFRKFCKLSYWIQRYKINKVHIILIKETVVNNLSNLCDKGFKMPTKTISGLVGIKGLRWRYRLSTWEIDWRISFGRDTKNHSFWANKKIATLFCIIFFYSNLKESGALNKFFSSIYLLLFFLL